jgi:riboflavin-specific deaminase-like protein
VRQLLPIVIDEVDPVALYAGDDRPSPAERPWVLVNMIASIDGATAIADRSAGLGGPADRAVFRALRELPDAIVVGAETARTEGYGPVRLDADAIERRHARGQASTPRLVLVSGSLELDITSAVFVDSTPPTIVVTHEASDAERRKNLEKVAEVVVAGATRVSMGEMLRTLRKMGIGTVLCEGGPIVNAQLLADGLVDEWCQTYSPLLVGGTSSRAAVGEDAHRDPANDDAPERLQLRRLLEADDMLMANYVRRS